MHVPKSEHFKVIKSLKYLKSTFYFYFLSRSFTIVLRLVIPLAEPDLAFYRDNAHKDVSISADRKVFKNISAREQRNLLQAVVVFRYTRVLQW